MLNADQTFAAAGDVDGVLNEVGGNASTLAGDAVSTVDGVAPADVAGTVDQARDTVSQVGADGAVDTVGGVANTALGGDPVGGVSETVNGVAGGVAPDLGDVTGTAEDVAPQAAGATDALPAGDVLGSGVPGAATGTVDGAVGTVQDTAGDVTGNLDLGVI